MFIDSPIYTPVVRSNAGDYSAAALVGADSVVLGWDICQSADRTDLLGFGIRRLNSSCKAEKAMDSRWLNGYRQMKCFPLATPAEKTSSRNGPIQRFWWCDNSAESGTTYEYAIVPVRGTPLLSILETPLVLSVTTAASALKAGDNSTSHEPQSVPVPELTTDEVLIRLIRSARSAILISTPGPFSGNVAAALDEAGQRTLVYGFTDANTRDRFSNGLSPNVQLMSRDQHQSGHDPAFALDVDGRLTSRTSAIVIDPWGDAPMVLLWTSPPLNNDAAQRPAEGLLLCHRPDIAAMVGSTILRRFSDCKLSSAETVGARIPGVAHDLLESDGRWSGMYFSPYCRSYKFRERQVFAGYP